MIDIGRALDLLATAATQRGEHFTYPLVSTPHAARLYAARGGPQGIVRRALTLAQVGDDDLDELRDQGVRELYGQGRLRVRLTLGAVAVLDAAERSQDRGYAWADALDYATSVAMRFLDLLPDAALDAANGGKITTAQVEIDGAS